VDDRGMSTQDTTAEVGIIGAGRLGQAMARTVLRAGRQVVLANSRGPETLASVVSTLGDGASAGTVEQAARAGIVVIAVPWPRVAAAVEGLRWDDRIVIDATNNFDPSDLNGSTSSQVVAGLVSGARVLKAASTLGAPVLGSDPHEAGGRRVIFLSGDDADAKSEVGAVFETRASSASTSAAWSPAARCSGLAARCAASI
jgi:predicted dinucleotide-binding enzyme